MSDTPCVELRSAILYRKSLNLGVLLPKFGNSGTFRDLRTIREVIITSIL